MATSKTNRCHNDGKKSSIIDRKRRKFTRIAKENVFMMFLISFTSLLSFSLAQFPGNNPGQYPGNNPVNPLLGDRDPRFYSRPGVDYNPPNPGDKEYRYEKLF